MLSAADILGITATVASSLDASLPLSRKTTASDGYGHSTETWASVGSVQCNVIKPSATQLQTYAGIIGSKAALMLRYMATSDVREGDRFTYIGKNWLVQNILNAESYTVANECLITAVQ